MTANAFDPGLMPGTGLAREHSAPIRFVWNKVLPRILPVLRRLTTSNVHSTAESGAALARLVADPPLADTNGKYSEGQKEIRSSIESSDAERARDLWNVSAELTGLVEAQS